MNLTKPAQRNEGIDILICVAAFFVVCLHEWFLGEFGLYVHSVARFAVPVFLMITGYFYEGVVRRGREAAQIKCSAWKLLNPRMAMEMVEKK